MRILVCGGRNFGDLQKFNEFVQDDENGAIGEYKFIHRKLDHFAREFYQYYNPNDNWLPQDIVIIEGGARGVDRAAADWAVINYVKFEEYIADWKTYGPAAGPIRNLRMLDEGKPDIVVAFPGGKGTADMIKRAKEELIPVIEVKYNE